MIMSRNLAIAGTAAMSLTLAHLPANAGEILYGTTGAGRSASSLYTIDPSDGTATLVGAIGFDEVVSIDFHPITGVLYGISNDNFRAPNTLITIDTTTGVGTAVVTVTGINQSPDMSFASDGTLYTWSESSPDNLNTVDLTTGVATEVGPNSLDTAQLGLDVDSTDRIYVKNFDGKIYTVDAGTGAATFVVDIGGFNFDNSSHSTPLAHRIRLIATPKMQILISI